MSDGRPALDRRRLRRLLGMFGSDHDGEVVNAARMVHDMLQTSGASWEELIPEPPAPTPPDTDLDRLDQLLASFGVSDVIKIRLRQMRGPLMQGRLGPSERKWLRLLHRKAVIEGIVVVA